MPGFVDGHPHMDTVGARLIRPAFGIPTRLDDILAVVKREVAKHKPGEWVLFGPAVDEPDVYNYPGALAEGRWPNRHDLDKVAPDNPIFVEAPLMVAPGLALFNTAGLKAIGLTKNTVPPRGVEVERDPSGEPTGIIKDSNFPKVRPESYGAGPAKANPPVPPLSDAEMVSAVEAGMRAFNAAGITAIYEGHGLPKEPQRAYLDVWQRKALTVRTYFVIQYPIPFFSDRAKGDALIAETALYAAGDGFGDDLLKFGGIGISFDGTSTVGTPLMRKPYHGARNQFWIGHQHATDENFGNILLRCARANLRVQVKCAGGLAIDKILDMFQAIDREIPIAGKRWVIEHCQFPSKENMEACRRLGVIPTSTTNFLWNYGSVYLRDFGREIADVMVPYRSWIDAGVPVVHSTDGRPFEPLFSFWQMLARKDGVTGTTFGLPQQKLTRAEALRLYTFNAARAAFWEDRIGSLEIGKLADLVVLSDDIMTMPEERIPETKVLATLLGGTPVFDMGLFGEKRP